MTWLSCVVVGFAVTCALGEGLAAMMASGVLLALVVSKERALLLAATKKMQVILWVALASIAAALVSPFGLRPAALGQLAPYVMLPTAFAATCPLGRATRARAATAFVLTTLLGGLLAWILGVFDVDPHAWVRGVQHTRSHRQAFAPGTCHQGVGGLLAHRLKFASALVMTAQITFAALLARLRTQRTRAQPTLLSLMGALCLSWLLLLRTQARAYAVALVAGHFAMALCCLSKASKRWRQGMLVCLAIAGAVCGYLVLDPQRASRAPWTERWPLWQCGVDTLVDHPFGVGIGNVSVAMDLCLSAHVPWTRSPRTGPHQTLLGTWMMAGGFAVLLWFQFYGWHLLRACRAMRSEQTSSEGWIAAALFVGLTVSFAVAGLSHDVLHHAITAWTFFAVTGATLAVLDEDLHKRP